MKRFLVGCGVLVLGLVTLLVVAYVVAGIHGTIRVHQARDRARAAAVAGLPGAQEQAARTRSTTLALLDRGQPAYAWSELVCDFDSIDAGWIVQDYAQTCQVRTVDLFPTDQPTHGRCEFAPRPGSGVLPGERSGGRVTLELGPATSLASATPWQHGCTSGIFGPPFLGRTRLLSGERPASLAASPAWLVVETQTEVSRTLIGCHPWKPVFCDMPYDEPILPDPVGS